MNIRIFDEEAVANLMLHYTAGLPRRRHAVLAINMQGGGGFEVWQHKEHQPQAPDSEPHLGDTGIFITKLKSKNVNETFSFFKSRDLNLLNKISQDPLLNPDLDK